MLLALFCLVLLALILLLTERISEVRDLRRYPPPGHLSYNLHLVSQGAQPPTVILESGLAASSLSWVLTQPRIAEFAQVIAYDRPGLGWSSPSNSPPTLHSLLNGLALIVSNNRPLILVGHSFGALLVRAFAHRHPQLVAAVVLLDPVSIDTYSEPDSLRRKRLETGIRLSHRGALLARFAIVRGALALVRGGSTRLPSLIGKISAGKGSSVMNRLAGEVAKLPPETHGPIRSHWSRPASFRVMAQYLQLLPEAARQVREMPIPAHIPVVILSAATATAAELAERALWASAHPQSRHTQIPNTTHWIQLDRPDLVVAAIRELSAATKQPL